MFSYKLQQEERNMDGCNEPALRINVKVHGVWPEALLLLRVCCESLLDDRILQRQPNI